MASDQASEAARSAARHARVMQVRDASRGLLGELDLRWLVPISLLAIALLRVIALR